MQFLPRRAKHVILATALVALSTSACAPSVDIASAEDSNNPACAPTMVALPDTLAEAQRRTTTTQATAAWGEPSLVVLRCGVAPLGPTTDPCTTLGGVDWVAKDKGEYWTFTSFGRTPAVEVTFNPNKIQSSNVIAQLSSAAAKLPKNGRSCS